MYLIFLYPLFGCVWPFLTVNGIYRQCIFRKQTLFLPTILVLLSQLFESGAIMLYLANKTGKFGGENEREKALVTVWLMWQMGGFGPMLGMLHKLLYILLVLQV